MDTLQRTKAQLLAEIEGLRRQVLGLQEAVEKQHAVEEQRRESEEDLGQVQRLSLPSTGTLPS